jgi:hypothetical protein
MVLGLLLTWLLLAGSGASKPITNVINDVTDVVNPPPTQQPLMPQPTTGWAITEGSGIGLQADGTNLPAIPLATPTVAFPVGPAGCGTGPGTPSCAQTSWVSYVELNTAPLPLNGTLTLSYTITASPDAVFNNDSRNNTGCNPPWPAMSLIIHRAGDQGLSPAQDTWRLFSTQRAQITPGSGTLSIPLTAANWIGVMGATPAEADFEATLAGVGSIGIGFGGGCFAAHGVAMKAGTGAFTANGFAATP